MNNLKIIAATGLIAVPFAKAEIVVTEDLSLYGYVDMAATYFDLDDGMGTDQFDASVAEVELGLDFTTGEISGVAEFSFDGSDANFETVTITYAVDESLSVTAGNILSYLGWETYDATGLYQFSYAYRGFSPLYPAYAAGGSIDYATDDFSLGIWVGEGSDEKASVEVAGKFTGVEGLTIFGGYANDPGYETYNIWASYEVDALTFALEWILTEMPNGDETTGYLAMVNYAVDKFGLTGRYSIQTDDFAGTTGDPEDWELLTISPSYAFSDNLLGLLEFSKILGGFDASDYQIAAELIFMF